jgi:uncharacterized protein YkwD
MRPVVPMRSVVFCAEDPPVSINAAARFRYAVVAAATTAVIGVGFTAIGLHQRGADSSPRSADAALVAAPPEGAGAGTGGLLDDAASATTGAETAPSVLPLSPTPAASASTSSKPVVTNPKPRKTTSPTRKPTKPTPPPTGSTILNAVLADINEARTAAGLSALTIDANLSKASALHNQLMINGCGLSHQCPGEESIGPRFSAQGVQWTSAGENIGFGSSGSSDAAIIAAANGLTASMLAEKPPNDGHRKNLLSSSFKRIGLSVVRDSSGKTWMVQDFVN